MKKTIIISTLLMLALGVSAQPRTELSAAAASRAPRSLTLDLRAGASVASFGDLHLTLGLRAGAALGIPFGRHLGLRTGLFYTEKGATTSNNPFNRSASRTTRLLTLDLPVELLGVLRFSERHRLELHGGFYLARLLRSKIPASAPFRANGWDTGVLAGVDFLAGHFIIGPEVQYGLSKIVTPGSNHNITYALTFGYRF